MMDKTQSQKTKAKRQTKKQVNTKHKKINKVEQDKIAKKIQPATKVSKKKVADEKSANQKKSKVIIKLFTWTILVGIMLGILVFLCKSEVFKICNIEITGNNQITKELILELSQINLQENIFLTNTNKAQKNIIGNPYIKEVKITRMLPDKIKIKVVEKEKTYMLQIDGNYVYIDQDGYFLEISENKLDNLIILEGYSTKKEEIILGNTLNEDDLEKLEDMKQILKSAEKNEIRNYITSINIKDKNNYILKLPIYKKIVYIGDTGNLATKMLRTKDIIDKTMEQEGKIFVNGDFNEGFDPYFREESNN